MESLGMAIEVFDGYVSNRARNPRAAQKSAVVPLSIIDETAAAGRPPIRWRHRFPGWSHGLNGSRMADPEKKELASWPPCHPQLRDGLAHVVAEFGGGARALRRHSSAAWGVNAIKLPCV